MFEGRGKYGAALGGGGEKKSLDNLTGYAAIIKGWPQGGRGA